MAEKKISLESFKHYGPLPFGIVPRIKLTGVTVTEDTVPATEDGAFLRLQFDQLSEDNKILARNVFPFFRMRLNTTRATRGRNINEIIFNNIREIMFQLYDLVAAYIGQEKATEFFENDGIEPLPFSTLDEWKNNKWTDEQIAAIESYLGKKMRIFFDTYKDVINNNFIKLKVVPNSRNGKKMLPRYGSFAESMDADPAYLQLSQQEKSLIEKTGLTHEERTK